MYALICSMGRYSTMLCGMLRSGPTFPPSPLIEWQLTHSRRKIAKPAAAASLDQLRQQGVLAERYDGYVVVRQNKGGAAQLAAQINAQRRKLYTQRAQQQRISVDQVGRVYARQIWSKAPRGTWMLDASNRWVRK